MDTFTFVIRVWLAGGWHEIKRPGCKLMMAEGRSPRRATCERDETPRAKRPEYICSFALPLG